MEACDVCFQKVECSSFLSDLFGVVLSLSIEFICFTLQIYVHFILHFFLFFLGPNVVFQCESTSETHYPSLTSVEAGWPALLTCLTQSFCFVWTLDPIKKLGFCGFSSNLQFQLICKSRKDSWSLCGFHCCSFLFPLVFPLGLITVVISMHIKLSFAWWDCRHTKTHYLHSLSELFWTGTCVLLML